MIYLSGVKGTYPVRDAMPPSLGRYQGWAWHRFFNIIHSLLARPFDQDTYQRAIYAFQSLPRHMVFSDPVITAAWARFVQLYSGHDRQMALKYMATLPRMTGRFRFDDTRNWYQVEKEWQRDEDMQQPAPNLSGMPDLEQVPPPPPPPIQRAILPAPVPRGVPVQPPPPPPIQRAILPAPAPRRVPVQPAPPPPIAPLPPVARLAPQPRIVESPAPRSVTAPTPAPIRAALAAPAAGVTPDSVLGRQVDNIIADHVMEGTQSQIEASLNAQQIAYLDKTPGWREHLRKMFPEPETPGEAIEERAWQYELSLPGVKSLITNRLDLVLWRDGQSRFKIPPVAFPRQNWEYLVDQVYMKVFRKITREQIGKALRIRGYYPTGEGVLTMPAQARLEWHIAQTTPGPAGERLREPDPIRAALDQILETWQGKAYALVSPTPTILPFFGAAESRAYGLADLNNRKDWLGIYNFTRADVGRYLRARGYISELDLRPPPPKPVPKAPEVYDRYKVEIGPIRRGLDAMLESHMRKKYAPYVTPRQTILPQWEVALRSAYSLAQLYNRQNYGNRYSFTKDDVERTLRARGYIYILHVQPPASIAPPPPPAPVVAPRVQAPAPIPAPTPAAPYNRFREEMSPVRMGIDDVLKKWRGIRYPTVVARPTRLRSFAEAVKQAYEYAAVYNVKQFTRRYRFTRADVEKAFIARNYRQHAPAREGLQMMMEAPPPAAISGLFNGYTINGV